MSDAEITQLLEQPMVAVLGTTDESGQPALAPVWYRWRGDDAVICTQTSTRRWRNIERNPRASLVVDTKEAPYRAVILEGVAEAEADADYEAVLAEIAAHYLGDDGGREFMDNRTPSPETSVVFRIRPDRIIAWAY